MNNIPAPSPWPLPPSPPTRAPLLALWGVLLTLAFNACGGCGEPPIVNPAPPSNSFQPLGLGQLFGVGDLYTLRFDPQGRPITGHSGLRRWSPESGLWEPLGTDVEALNFTVDGAGTVYTVGAVLPTDSALWQRPPSMLGGSSLTTAGMAQPPVVDAQGNLYTFSSADGAPYRLRPGTTYWEKLPLSAIAQHMVINPRGDRLYLGVDGTPAVYEFELHEGALSATLFASDTLPQSFDADGTAYAFVFNGPLNTYTLFKVTPDGTKTQLAETTASPDAPIFNGGVFRDTDGAWYGTALEPSGNFKYVIKLEPGQTQWKTLAQMSDLYNLIAVRDDGLVLEYSPRAFGLSYVNELYGTGKKSLLADAHEKGVALLPSSVSLLGGDSATVGLTILGATKTEGLSVNAPSAEGLSASPGVKLVPHGVAGVLQVQAEPDISPGTHTVTVKSADGDSATLEVVVDRPRLEAASMRRHTLAGGNTVFGVKQDGTVWRWSLNADITTPRGVTTQQPGVWGAISVAQDSLGYGAVYAVRVDGTVWSWNSYRSDFAPVLVPGLSNIIAVAAGTSSAVALDASGRVWHWISGDAVNYNIGAADWVPPTQVPELSDVVALAPGFSALRADGTVWTFPELDLTARPQRVETLAGVKAIAQGVAVRADGSLWQDGMPVVLRNDEVEAAFHTSSTPLNPTVRETTDALLALRSDGTVWDHSIISDNLHPRPAMPITQLDTPADVQGLAVYVTTRTLVTGDGRVWQGHATSSAGLMSFTRLEEVADIRNHRSTSILIGDKSFSRLEDIADIRTSTPLPEFGVFGPTQATVVARGTTVTLPLSVVRTSGFSGPLTVSALELPSGFSVAPLTLPDGATSATLSVSASADAARLGPTDVPLQVSGGGITRVTYVKLRTPIEPAMPHPTIAAGYAHGLAVKSDGTVWAWGSNVAGQLGLGTADSARHDTAVQVPGLSSIVAVAAGSAHSLALDASGQVWAWGDNSQHQAGQSTPSFLPSPTLVPGLPPIRGIAASQLVSFVLATDGKVWGLGSTSTAYNVSGVALWTEAYNELNLVVIQADGGVMPLGNQTCSLSSLKHVVRGAGVADSYYAVLDDLSVVKKNPGDCVPLAVPAMNGTVALTPDVFVRGDGSVWSWDRYNPGTASGTPAPTTFPFQVPGVSSAVDLAGARSTSSSDQGFVLLLQRDGSVWAYGRNDHGQAGGPGDTTSVAYTPQQVPGLTGIRQP